MLRSRGGYCSTGIGLGAGPGWRAKKGLESLSGAGLVRLADVLACLAGVEIASFVAAASVATDPGRLLGLVEQAALGAAGRFGQALIQQTIALTDGYVGATTNCRCGGRAVFKGRLSKTVATMSGPVKAICA